MAAYKDGIYDYEEWFKASCKRKYNSDFSREMTRYVFCEALGRFGSSQNIFKS